MIKIDKEETEREKQENIIFSIQRQITYIQTNKICDRDFVDFLPFIEVLLVECLYNAILTIILYPLMRHLGNKVENEYKGNKILTRYF